MDEPQPPPPIAAGAAAAAAAAQANEARLLILGAQREGNRALVTALRPLGLTPAQAEVIAVLGRCEPLTVAAIGSRIVCEGGSPSRLVDSCVRRGWIERTEGADRRTVQLRLAPAGRALLPEIEKADNAIGLMISAAIGDDDLLALTKSLRLMLEGTASGAKISQRFDAG